MPSHEPIHALCSRSATCRSLPELDQQAARAQHPQQERPREAEISEVGASVSSPIRCELNRLSTNLRWRSIGRPAASSLFRHLACIRSRSRRGRRFVLSIEPAAEWDRLLM
jgi:hypothetical protein